MQEPSSRATLAHSTLLLVVGAGRTPTASASPGRPGEVRLMMDVAGTGYGASVVWVGPAEVLGQVVADLAAALEGVRG
jgi:hypothetical protein